MGDDDSKPIRECDHGAIGGAAAGGVDSLWAVFDDGVCDYFGGARVFAGIGGVLVIVFV